MNNKIKDICSNLQNLLEKAVKRNIAEGILLSGGLDTSIIAALASKFVSLKAFTVAFKAAAAPDVEFAKLIAKKLQINHLIHYFGKNELYNSFRETIKIVKSFDPMEIRNSAAIYIGLKLVKEKGIKRVMTGDGADELFAGYNFLFRKTEEELELELKKINRFMSFSSIILAKSLGIEAKLPFLDPEFRKCALHLPAKYKVVTKNGRKMGKWILRKAFESILPNKIAWRDKVPIEKGTGTTKLPDIFKQEISDIEFNQKRQKYLKDDKVKIRDKEHLFYYEIYRNIIGIPYPTDLDKRICPNCNSNVNEKATFCKTCGAYPI